ncbi:MAG: aminopeptidase family protein P, partial [Prolixibacteraceae bacterium]|nr:aminopeptidase family protein P [Prolixibacteraceae bacterium]
SGSKVGFDPQTIPVTDYRKLSARLGEGGISFVETPDLFEKIWQDRPELPQNDIFELSSTIAGLSRREKKELVSAGLKKCKADFQIVTASDELAWLFNLRGSDVPYNPVFMGFGIVGKSEYSLFVYPGKLSAELKAKLEKDKVKLRSPGEFQIWLKSAGNNRIFIDPLTANYAIYKSVCSSNKIFEGISIISMLKAGKNKTELAGFREAMKKDGVALVEFLFWLKSNIEKGYLTEYTIGKKLNAFRSKQDKFMGDSFPPIVGYREHGAVVHLNVGEDDALPVRPEGILLIDSGGHYLHGTTDITRTIALGPVTERQKTDFTLVLKGMIALSTAIFPAGTKGSSIDMLARKPLWENGLNYGHGTGHGVGHFLNVHEGPVSIRQESNPKSIMPGMVFSNEPGLYREGEYGIRTENLILCVQKKSTEFGAFLGFETLTLCPVDINLIDIALLSSSEREWINSYHKMVRRELTPCLSPELKSYLEELTREI